MNAVRKMAKPENLGEKVIPHLFVGVRNKYTRHYTTELLNELTGQPFTVKQSSHWANWWKKTHPGWKEDAKDDSADADDGK